MENKPKKPLLITEKVVSFWISEDVMARFRAKLEKSNTNMSCMVEAFIRWWLGDIPKESIDVISKDKSALHKIRRG